MDGVYKTENDEPKLQKNGPRNTEKKRIKKIFLYLMFDNHDNGAKLGEKYNKL